MVEIFVLANNFLLSDCVGRSGPIWSGDYASRTICLHWSSFSFVVAREDVAKHPAGMVEVGDPSDFDHPNTRALSAGQYIY